MTVQCRILKIDINKFHVELTSRSSDLRNERHKSAFAYAAYYDHDGAETAKQSAQNNSKIVAKTGNSATRITLK